MVAANAGRTVSSADPRITALTFDRMRLGISIEIVGVLAGLVMSDPSGIPLRPSVIAINVVVLAIAFVTAFALRGNRIPARYAHHTAAAMWLLAPITTLSSMAATNNPNLVFPLLIELALAPIMQLSLRHLIVSTGLVVVVYLALSVELTGPDTLLHVASVVGLLVASWLVSRGIRRSFDSAILRDDEQVATAALLQRELDQRRKAEAEREGIRDQFIHAQRMDAVGTLAAGLAHDMNNILAGILGLAEVAGEEATQDSTRADLEAIARETRRAAELTRSLLAYSRRGQYQRGLVALDAVVDELEPLIARMLSKRVALERRGSADVTIDVDAAQLGQAIVNLCINGADAMDGHGTLTITTAVVTLDATEATRLALAPGSYGAITVRDSGRGIDESVRSKIFEPFFTTKPVGQGTGLGLAMVYGTVHGHGGAIEVVSAAGEGAAFTIYLPASTRPVVAPAVTPPRESSSRLHRGASRLALVVDDEPMMRAITTRILRDMGLSVVGASDGAEALDVFATRGDEISLVVLDMSMPVMGGAECFREIRRTSHVPVLIASGFADQLETQQLLSQGKTMFLEKPFSVEAMRGQVERALDLRDVLT